MDKMTSNQRSGPLLVSTMIDEIKFLREKAAALRTLSHRAPAIAEALRRLADELELKAADLERPQGHPPAGSEPG
jgi:hypothetical protein